MHCSSWEWSHEHTGSMMEWRRSPWGSSCKNSIFTKHIFEKGWQEQNWDSPSELAHCSTGIQNVSNEREVRRWRERHPSIVYSIHLRFERSRKVDGHRRSEGASLNYTRTKHIRHLVHHKREFAHIHSFYNRETTHQRNIRICVSHIVLEKVGGD